MASGLVSGPFSTGLRAQGTGLRAKGLGQRAEGRGQKAEYDPPLFALCSALFALRPAPLIVQMICQRFQHLFLENRRDRNFSVIFQDKITAVFLNKPVDIININKV